MYMLEFQQLERVIAPHCCDFDIYCEANRTLFGYKLNDFAFFQLGILVEGPVLLTTRKDILHYAPKAPRDKAEIYLLRINAQKDMLPYANRHKNEIA